MVADRRYLGGISLRDASTGTPIEAPMHLVCDGVKFFRSRRGIFVIASAVGFEEHTDSFDAPPPTTPGEETELRAVVEDPSGLYLPRSFTLRLPRVEPWELIVVDMFRSPRAEIAPNWGVIRGRLVNTSGEALSNAVVRVLRDSDQTLLAACQAVPALDREKSVTPISPRLQGEIAVPLIGVPVTQWGDDDTASVLIDEVAVTLEVVPISGGVQPVDPDEHLATPSLPENRWPLNVASGRQVNAGVLSVTVP